MNGKRKLSLEKIQSMYPNLTINLHGSSIVPDKTINKGQKMKTQADYMQELDELKALRGWNDKELARQLDTTSAMISKWRTGKTAMTAKIKNKILTFFQRLAIEPQDTKACYLSHCPAKPPVDRFLQAVLESWDLLGVEDKAKVAGLAASLAEVAAEKSKVG